LAVAALLVGAACVTGALAGFAGGVGWALLFGEPLNAAALLALAVGCLVLDLGMVTRVAPPFSVLRQVPMLWGRIFSAPTVAVLYGARLGVGPLTILRTWLWWGAFLAGASAGAWWSLAVGAVFGTSRVVVMLVAGTRAGRLQGRERVVKAVVAVASIAAVAVAGRFVDVDARSSVPASAGAGLLSPSSSRLEATSSTTARPASAPPSSGVPDTGLGAALPEVLLPGWTRAEDDPARRLGPLDLAAAAAAERDAPAEQALLETRHFVRGHARGWRGPDGQVGYASVYEFATAADAAAYRADGLTTLESRGARVYDAGAPAPVGSRAFSQAGRAGPDAGSTVSHGVVFVDGARFALVFVSGRDSGIDPGDAASAAASVRAAWG
jgi:hypothetical protein